MTEARELAQTVSQLTAAWRGSLIVSCQAPAGSPMARDSMIAALAETVAACGARGVRVDGPAHVKAVRAATRIPILGIWKRIRPGSDVYITATFEDAAAIAGAGADAIAVDATPRPRAGGATAADLIARISRELTLPVVADVATLDEGLAAADAGAHFVATTLAGYTADTRDLEGPAFALVEALARRCPVPVLCEGRLRTPADVRRAFDAGAFAVVVGTAITGVDILTRELLAATPGAAGTAGR